MKLLLPAVLAAGIATAGLAQTWHEPPRGSAERRALMDTLRPLAEDVFGAPVEFVIRDLRVSGHVAFASVTAQRPGGGRIDVGATPGWASGYFMADADWTGGQALFRQSQGRWILAEGVFGATDVWWSDPVYCSAGYAPVISEMC